MSSCRRSCQKEKRKHDRIELQEVLKFIKFIQIIASCMLGISLLGMFFARKDEGALAIYLMVIIVNVIIVFLGKIPIKYLMKKDT